MRSVRAAFEDHEQLFLRVVEVIGAGTLAGGDDVDAEAKLGRRGAAREPGTQRFVKRLALFERLVDRLEIADQPGPKFLRRRHHGEIPVGQETGMMLARCPAPDPG